MKRWSASFLSARLFNANRALSPNSRFWRQVALSMSQATPRVDAASALRTAQAPLSDAPCRSCPDPCDQGHEELPKKFGIDTTSDMLGSVKPYRRIVVISTGKSDWYKAVTEVDGTLASYLLGAEGRLALPPSSTPDPQGMDVQGVLRTADSTRITILNGSHPTTSDDESLNTVLLFPDYKVITQVASSEKGAEYLWRSYVDPHVGRAGLPLEGNPQHSYILPYSCVVQICSHKSKDNRCGAAAMRLEPTIIQCLESIGWTVHTQVEELPEPSIESQEPERRDSLIIEHLKILPTLKRVLLVKNSHFGGHKYAGNCVIHFPLGSSVWYGRVTSHHVPAIVEQTIIAGKILLPLLRAGADIIRPSRQSLYDW